MKHWLEHLFGWNGCFVVSKWHGEELWLAAQCVGCGKRSNGFVSGKLHGVQPFEYLRCLNEAEMAAEGWNQ